MGRFIISLGLLFSAKVLAVGAWYQKSHQFPMPGKGSFFPTLVILKSGVFSNSGDLREIDSKDNCLNSSETIAWVTHKLSQGETLNYESGKTLGKNLTKNFTAPCISAVELDIEPLTEANAWLEGFLKGVRETLNPKLKLRLAIPILSPKKLTGNFWSLRDGVKGIEWTDGLDVMAYDSGATDAKEFAEFFKNTFFFVMELVKQSPTKDIIVGLPAYQDKTKLHQTNAENLMTVLSTLKQFTPFQVKPMCSGQIKLAYYAGWTLTAQDQATHKKIEEWIHEICKKNS